MSAPIDFRIRLSRERPYGQNQGPLKTPECSLEQLSQALESDRGRIINSAAIRRLQQRTQVFPLERNAAVRSRLTHSLEVQQTGRFIVRTLYQQLGERAADYGLQGLQPILESLVEMGCLLHDVGNPPFGHFGEFAIGEWFERYLKPRLDAAPTPAAGQDSLERRMLADLMRFEGNAQSIRLVVRLQRLNLTYSQTACLIKYLRPAYRERPVNGAYRHKKPGFYLAEEAFIRALQKSQGLDENARHPLVYIVEAADDISYCLADIEDSVEKGILTIDRLVQLLLDRFGKLWDGTAGGADKIAWFGERVNYAQRRSKAETINKVSEFFVWLRVNMIHPLVQHAARQFIENIESIHSGALDRALMEDESLEHRVVQTFKEVAREQVFNHPEVDALQLKGYRIIQGLLDLYGPLLEITPDDFRSLVADQGQRHPHKQMLVRRLPNQLLKAYSVAVQERQTEDQPQLWEFYHRCRLLQDFVSGLTDQQAQDEYQMLSAF